MSNLTQLQESVSLISLADDERRRAKDPLGNGDDPRVSSSVPNEAVGCEEGLARCAALTPGKVRGCRRRPIVGSAYCGQHKSLDPNCARKKVPCPLDCRHSVWEDQVNAHVKVCETKRRAERVAKAQLLETSLPYYCRSINGRQTEVCYPDARTISTEQSTGGSTHSAAELSLADPLTWLRKVVEVSEQLFGTRLPRLYREEPQEVLQPFNGGTCAECQHCDVGDDTGNDDEDNGNEQDGDDENMPGGGGGEVTGTKTERAMKHALQEKAVAQYLQIVGLLPHSARSFSSSGNRSNRATAAVQTVDGNTTPVSDDDRPALVTVKPRFTYVEFGAGAGGLAWACAQTAAAAGDPDANSNPSRSLSESGSNDCEDGSSGDQVKTSSYDKEIQSSSATHSLTRARCDRPNVVLVERLPFPPSTDRRWLAQPLVGNGLAAALASPLKAPGFLRCQLDIRDFDLGGVSAARPDVDLRAAPPVAIGKHLCGAATDLTITAVTRQCCSKRKGCSQEAESDVEVELVGPLMGVAIVTCCHGLCNWEDYPTAAKNWLRDVLPIASLHQTEPNIMDGEASFTHQHVTATKADEYTAGKVGATSDDTNPAGVEEMATSSSLSCAEFECLRACSHWAVDGGIPNEEHHPSSRIYKRDQKRAAAAAAHLAQLEAAAAQEEEAASKRAHLANVAHADGSTSTDDAAAAAAAAATAAAAAAASLGVRPAAAALAHERARRRDIDRMAVAAKSWRRGISAQERKRIGRACKYLLDGGRRETLRQYGQWNGLQCELFELVGSDVTPENTLLLAWPTGSH